MGVTDTEKLRRAAEKITRGETSRSPASQRALTIKTSQRILHELQVHQIELEMQNQELRHSLRELESARSRYFDLYDLAPVGYVTFSNAGLIQESNLTFATMLDIPRANLINRQLSTFILRADQDIWSRFRMRLPETDSSKICEIRILKKKTGPFWVRIEVGTSHNDVDGPPVYRAAVSDITEQKRMNGIHLSRSHLMQFAGTHTLKEILVETLNELETLTDSSIGFYHYYDAETQSLTLTAWSTRTSNEFCHAEGSGSHYPLERAGVWVDCIHQGKPVIHNNFAELSHRKGFPEGHASVMRELVVPVIRDNRIVAILGVGNKPGEYSQEHIDTVSLFADLAFDIAEKKQAEEALRATSVYARTLIEASLDPLVTISADGKITDVNEATERVTGVPREQLIGTNFSLYFTDSKKARKGYRKVFSDGVVRDYPLAIKNISGTITDVLYNASVYRDENGEVRGVFAAARDVTNQKRAEEALKQARDELENRVAERTFALASANEQMKKISFEMVWAEERERERIAGELHDQVGHSLLLAKMKLDALASKTRSVSLRASAEEASSLLQTSIHDIRTLTFRMRPPILDTAGIDTSLEWLCSSLCDDYSIRIEFASDRHAKPLSAAIRYSLYQSVRELLLNVVKHAGAEKARLSIKADNSILAVLVEDDGIGFNHSDPHLKRADTGGYGLYNIQLRIEHLGGDFSITSMPGQGTSAKILVPLSEPLSA